MRIVHICLAGPFSEGYSYQENLLTKYQVLMGHEVFVITAKWSLDSNASISKTYKSNYFNEDRVKIFRMEMKGKDNYSKKLKIFEDYSKLLNEIEPEIIFVHGSQFLDIKPIIQYKIRKDRNVKIFVDNHADFSNSATNFISREILHKKIWRLTTKRLEPYVTKFYGVLPARVDFLKNIYHVSEKKVSLLNMGGDDEFVRKYLGESTDQFREEIGCKREQQLIVTGGKVDEAKKEVLLLMEYVRSRKDLFLLIFGSIDEKILPQVKNLLSDNVKYIGWVNSEKSYKYFSESDLVVFPGRHSVYWEQVVSQKKPMLVKYWEGTDHIDIGGNVSIIDYHYNEKEKLFYELDQILYSSKLNDMKKAAESENATAFLYSDIAKRSIEEV